MVWIKAGCWQSKSNGCIFISHQPADLLENSIFPSAKTSPAQQGKFTSWTSNRCLKQISDLPEKHIQVQYNA